MACKSCKHCTDPAGALSNEKKSEQLPLGSHVLDISNCSTDQLRRTSMHVLVADASCLPKSPLLRSSGQKYHTHDHRLRLTSSPHSRWAACRPSGVLCAGRAWDGTSGHPQPAAAACRQGWFCPWRRRGAPWGLHLAAACSQLAPRWARSPRTTPLALGYRSHYTPLAPEEGCQRHGAGT